MILKEVSWHIQPVTVASRRPFTGLGARRRGWTGPSGARWRSRAVTDEVERAPPDITRTRYPLHLGREATPNGTFAAPVAGFSGCDDPGHYQGAR